MVFKRNVIKGQLSSTTPAQISYLYNQVKMQVSCVGDRLKMNKHKACSNNSVVAPKSVGSMTTRGQMKQTIRVSFNCSKVPKEIKFSLKTI